MSVFLAYCLFCLCVVVGGVSSFLCVLLCLWLIPTMCDVVCLGLCYVLVCVFFVRGGSCCCSSFFVFGCVCVLLCVYLLCLILCCVYVVVFVGLLSLVYYAIVCFVLLFRLFL